MNTTGSMPSEKRAASFLPQFTLESKTLTSRIQPQSLSLSSSLTPSIFRREAPPARLFLLIHLRRRMPPNFSLPPRFFRGGNTFFARSPNGSRIAYSLIKEQEGQKRVPDDYISFVGLLADPQFGGISYVEKEEVRVLLRQDPNFWTYRPLSELMVRAAADDVRFLLFIYHKMVEKLNERSLWYLKVRGALYCRCFCINDNNFADWPALPPVPESLIADKEAPEEETLSVLDVPPGKMGCIIGKRGANILSIKEGCSAEIFFGGDKGPPNKVFIIGPVKQVKKAEAMLRGRMLNIY